MRRGVVLLCVCFLAALPACKGCNEDKPYTPFGAVSAPLPEALPPASASAATSASASAAQKPGFAPVKATLAPKGATHWKPGEREIAAPDGRVLERAVSMDVDGDGHADDVVWTLPVTPRAPTASPGELWLYPGTGDKPRRLASLPGFVPSGPDCALTAELTGSGPHSVTLDASAHCKTALLARAPTRALLVVSPASPDRPVLLELRVAEAASGESLALSIDSSDRDGDGHDDVDLSVTVGASGSRYPATAQLIWLDRTAGPSREADEPTASFERQSAGASVRSRQKLGSASVAERVANTRRLMWTICGESGVARLFDREGATFRCGGQQLAVDRLALAELQAALTQGDVREAGAVLLRDGWYLAPASAKIRQRMQSAFEKAAPRVVVPDVKTLSATVAAGGSEPRWNPIRFDGDGALLVESASGVVRVAPDGSEQALGAEAGVVAWPLAVTGSDGARWIGVQYPCENPDVELAFQGGGSAPLPPVPTGVLAPRPGSCAHGAFDAHLPRVPVAWSGKGLEALVAGSLVGPHQSDAAATMKPGHPGAPRSPDGRYLATPSVGGVLVTGPGKPALWTGAGLDAKTIAGCTVADDAKAVACVDGAHVLLARRP